MSLSAKTEPRQSQDLAWSMDPARPELTVWAKLVLGVTSSFRRLTVSNADTRFSAGSNAEARRRRWCRWASFWIEPLTSRNGRNGPPCPKIVISYRSPRYSVARSTATTLRVGSSERSRRELHFVFLRRVDIFDGLGSRHKKPSRFGPFPACSWT